MQGNLVCAIIHRLPRYSYCSGDQHGLWYLSESARQTDLYQTHCLVMEIWMGLCCGDCHHHGIIQLVHGHNDCLAVSTYIQFGDRL